MQVVLEPRGGAAKPQPAHLSARPAQRHIFHLPSHVYGLGQRPAPRPAYYRRGRGRCRAPGEAEGSVVGVHEKGRHVCAALELIAYLRLEPVEREWSLQNDAPDRGRLQRLRPGPLFGPVGPGHQADRAIGDLQSGDIARPNAAARVKVREGARRGKRRPVGMAADDRRIADLVSARRLSAPQCLPGCAGTRRWRPARHRTRIGPHPARAVRWVTRGFADGATGGEPPGESVHRPGHAGRPPDGRG